MAAIRIDSPTVTDQTLTVPIEATGTCKRFFTDRPLEVTYDVSLESVPDSILVIPALAQVCPVAWAVGADVYVDTVDAAFVSGLEAVETTLFELYDFLEGGQLYARTVTDTEPVTANAEGEQGESALLFTGGVDSTCSYVRHREASPTLVSIRGWTISPEPTADEQWAHLTDRVTQFASERGLETAFLEANMLQALDHPMLLAHYKRYVDGGWYSSVGHGLGLLGLCAPMAVARGVDDLYMAATHWDGIDLEWGSRPDIDEHVRWRGTRCHHDAYDLTRQERLDLIADYVRESAPDLTLQTCNRRMDGNCGECEKCYRTAVGVRLAGLEARDHGYPFTDADYEAIRRAFETGAWILGEDERYMWADIRERTRETTPRSPAERAFFQWLETVDLDTLVASGASPLHHRLLRAGARRTPNAVYSRLYPAYQTAKSGYRRLV